MVLMTVAPAGRETLPGFEYHSFKCATCRATERRLVFIRHGREVEADAIPTHEAPSIVPAVALEDARSDPFAVIARALDRIRGIKPVTPALSSVSTPAPAPTAPATKADAPDAVRK